MADVYLIGAGPGDPGLLTVKARDILSTADIIIYDYLANKEFLDLAKEDAEFIYVGKKGGDHTLPQDKINDLLVEKAGEGKMIARLKGGDPYVFGRGAEEAEELLEAGLTFEIVPGVTAGVAAAAYAGIPVTHRKYASSVSFITGHEDPTKAETALDWDALATGTSTLVFYMGVKNLPMISKRLMDAGMAQDTPAAIIRWGTTCKQRSFASTLAKIPAEAEKLGYKAPSIIIIGQVCALKEKLDWFGKRPLLGKTVVVTRARHQASGLVDLIRGMGGCVLEFPTIKIKPMPDYEEVETTILRLAQYDWLVFTSVNGVVHFFDQIYKTGLDARILGGIDVAAIGPATAKALEERGIRPDFVPDKYVAEHVVDGLVKMGIKHSNVLIPRALEAREVLPEKLAEAGAVVTVLPVYETTLSHQDPAEVLQGLNEHTLDYVTFTSSSTVRNFFELVPVEEFKKHRDSVKIACIGPITAKTLSEYGFSPDVQPEDYTVPALAEAVAADASGGQRSALDHNGEK